MKSSKPLPVLPEQCAPIVDLKHFAIPPVPDFKKIPDVRPDDANSIYEAEEVKAQNLVKYNVYIRQLWQQTLLLRQLAYPEIEFSNITIGDEVKEDE